MSLAGEIGEVAFSDVIQLCARMKSSGTLQLSSPDTGSLIGVFYFENGELFDARLADLQGPDAVHRALELKEGRFLFNLGVRARERRIFTSVESILLESARSSAISTVNGGYRTLSSLPPVSLADGAVQMMRPTEEWDDDNQQPDLETAGAAFGELPAPPPSPGPGGSPQPRAMGLKLQAWLSLGGAAIGVTIIGVALLQLLRPAPAPKPAPPEKVAAPVAQPRALTITPTSTVVPGVSDNEVRFGMVAPFSGPAQELGRQMRLGIETAFNAANDAGGVVGRRLKLIAEDDGYEPARTAIAMKNLRDTQKVFGFVGNVGTPTAAVALPLALEHRMLFFGAFSGANLLRNDPPDRYVFNFRASYGEETAAVVRYLVKVRHLHPENIVVFAQRDSFGDAGFAGVTRAMREIHADIRSTYRVGYQRNTTDVTDAVANLSARARSIPVRAVVMVATYRAAARFIEKVRDVFPKMIFTNVSFVGSTALADELKLLGKRYTTGVLVTQVVPPVERFSTAIMRYKESLAKFFPGEKSDYVSLEGYLVANVLIEGVRRTGRKLDTERLIDTLEGIRELDLGLGTPLTFGLAEHQASHRIWGTQLNDAGAYEVIDLR